MMGGCRFLLGEMGSNLYQKTKIKGQEQEIQ